MIRALLKLLAALATTVMTRAQERQAEGVGRTKAYAEAMEDAANIMQQISKAGHGLRDALLNDRDGVLSRSKYDRTKARSQRDDTGKEEGGR